MATLRLDVARVRQFMEERGLNERDLAAEMDIAYSYLNRLLRGKRGLGVHAIAGFLRAGLQWEDIFTVVDDVNDMP
ncbi:MAG: helix-turn-helix transcriptional regulator [Sulfobacillus thermotolerans]|nr:helix-turn-helix transcriptional regulator [Sulfobacillus thermotolerans]